MPQTEKPEKECEIWAVGGGKGGTGKTFITSSIGTYLARKGRQVVLVDMDIGGANLHSFFGLERPTRSLTSFFETGATLSDLVVRTEIESMTLITGDIHSLSTESLKFSQKLKLFRQIMKLHAQNVIIDLGAGSRANTLDTFLLAEKMIIVLTPEIIAIENMYHFIQNALFRKIKKTLTDYGFKETVQQIWDRRVEYGVKNLKDLIDHLKDGFPYIGMILDNELRNFQIYLILNMVRSNQDIQIGTSIKSVLKRYLGVPVRYVGYIAYDDAVWRSVRERKPFMMNYLSTGCAKEIETLVENIIRAGDIAVPGGLS
jgi:flagellar biosynthesis protein FlhG